METNTQFHAHHTTSCTARWSPCRRRQLFYIRPVSVCKGNEQKKKKCKKIILTQTYSTQYNCMIIGLTAVESRKSINSTSSLPANIGSSHKYEVYQELKGNTRHETCSNLRLLDLEPVALPTGLISKHCVKRCNYRQANISKSSGRLPLVIFLIRSKCIISLQLMLNLGLCKYMYM